MCKIANIPVSPKTTITADTVTTPEKTKTIKQQKKEQAAANRKRKEAMEQKKAAIDAERKQAAAERKKNRVDFLIEKRKRLAGKKQIKKLRRKISSDNKQLFEDLCSFFTAFKTNKKCLVELEKLFYPDGVIICPYCQSKDIWTSHSNRFQHKCLTCEQPFKVTTRTIFEHAHIPLYKILLAINLENTLRGGVTIQELVTSLKVSSRTAHKYLTKIRRYAYDQTIFASILTQSNKYGFTLTQQDNNKPYQTDTTESDGDDVNRPKWKKCGHKKGPNETQTFMAIQEDGLAKGKIIADLSGPTMIQAAKELIPDQSIVYSDSTASLNDLEAAGYKHEIVNHSLGEYSRKTLTTNKDNNITTVKCVTTNLVEWLNGEYKIGEEKHQNNFSRWGRGLYLNGTLFRVNTNGLTPSDKLRLALIVMSQNLLPIKKAVLVRMREKELVKVNKVKVLSIAA